MTVYLRDYVEGIKMCTADEFFTLFPVSVKLWSRKVQKARWDSKVGTRELGSKNGLGCDHNCLSIKLRFVKRALNRTKCVKLPSLSN